jgi:hypothetical protein
MTMVTEVRLPGFVERTAAWLAAASPWRVLAVSALVRAVTCGVWTTPNLDQWVLFARDPYGPAPIDPAAWFITNSPLGPLVAHTLEADTRLTYAAVHLGLAALSAATLVVLGRRTVGDRLTSALVVLLFVSPLSNIVLTWLGQPDAAMLGGLSAIGLASAFARRSSARLTAVVGGAVLGFASFEQGLAAVAVLAALVWFAGTRLDREVVVAGVGGLVLGRLGVSSFLAVSDVPNVSRADWARSIGAGVFVRTFLYNLPALAFSVLGVGWLLVGHAAGAVRARATSALPLLVPAGLALVAGLVALDETRVASMVIWPAAVWMVRQGDADREGGLDTRMVALTFLAGIVVPPIVIWEGSPYISSWFVIRQGW